MSKLIVIVGDDSEELIQHMHDLDQINALGHNPRGEKFCFPEIRFSESYTRAVPRSDQELLNVAATLADEVATGKTCFVCTHSETLVLALRIQIKRGNLSHEKVEIQFPYKGDWTRALIDRNGRMGPCTMGQVHMDMLSEMLSPR